MSRVAKKNETTLVEAFVLVLVSVYFVGVVVAELGQDSDNK